MSELSKKAQIAVIGAGTMGAGIAQVAANAGHRVVLFDIAEGAAQRGLDSVKAGLEKQLARGKIKQANLDQLLSRISPTTEIASIKESALVIEAIVENLNVKQSVLADVEALCSAQTIIASNTSSISISALAAKAQRPENVVGMHFFNPAQILKLVEVVSGLQTSADVANTVFATALAWGKKPVHTKSTPGFIVNRVARPFYAEAMRSKTEQLASTATIDTLMRDCGGFKMGPLELTDLIGQDINRAVSESVYGAYYQDKRFLPSVYQAEMVDAGLLGKKSGRGFYDYRKDSTGDDRDADIQELIANRESVVVHGNIDSLNGMQQCIDEAGIKCTTEYADSKESLQIKVGDAVIQLTDGRTASQRAAEQGIENLVLLDYASDYQQANHVGISVAVQASEQAKNDAVSFLQSISKHVCILKDLPGMQVMRTVCMLINEAYDAINQGVCDAEGVDVAMQAGVAYPQGPVAWSKNIGIGQVVTVLQNIQAVYGEERYRVSPLLQQAVYTKS